MCYSRPRYLAFFLTVIVVLLLHSGVGFAAQLDCDQVQIKMIHPLQFGHLRGLQGKKGWVYLQTNNEYFMSASIALRNDSFPSPGQVEIIAPSGCCLDLRISPERSQGQNGEKEKNIRLENLKVSSKTVPVTRISPDIYRGEVPVSKDGADVRFLLDIGGELSLKVTESLVDLSFMLYIECFDIRTL